VHSSKISNLRTFADDRLEGADQPRNRNRTSGRLAFGAAMALRLFPRRAPSRPLIAIRERPSRRFLICSPQSEASGRFVMTITEWLIEL
jgi:hypothetical protein